MAQITDFIAQGTAHPDSSTTSAEVFGTQAWLHGNQSHGLGIQVKTDDGFWLTLWLDRAELRSLQQACDEMDATWEPAADTPVNLKP